MRMFSIWSSSVQRKFGSRPYSKSLENLIILYFLRDSFNIALWAVAAFVHELISSNFSFVDG